MKIILALMTGSLMAAENPRLEWAMGVREEQHGEEAKALAHFEKAQSEDRLALPLVRKLVSLRLAAGDRDGALKLLRGLAEASPDRIEVQLEYSRFLEEQGRGDAMAEKLAVEILEGVLKKHPDDLSTASRLLTIYRERGDSERAKSMMESLPKDDPEAAEIYASASKALFKNTDAEARGRVDERFEAALRSHLKDGRFVRVASDYFRETGRADRAIEVLQQHVAAAPWSLDLRTRLGVLLFSAKRDDEGQAVLKEVVEIRPDSPLALQSLTKFYRLRGDDRQSRLYGAELLKVRGGSPKEFVILADEFLAAGEPRPARLLLEKGVFDHPDQPELAMKLAVATRQDPETKSRAGRLFREAEASMNGAVQPDAAFLLESAEVLAEEGQGKAAEERMRSAIRSYPPDKKKETAAALRQLAALWERENRNADAARALRQRADGLDR